MAEAKKRIIHEQSINNVIVNYRDGKIHKEVGMKQLVIKEQSKSLVHTVIGIKTGWRHEPVGKRGISHFLEHAVFLGNPSYPAPDDEVAKYGVQLNGMTGPEHILFYFTSMKEDFNKIFRLFLSLIFHPGFDETRLEKEKKEKIIPAVSQESDYTPWELAYEWARNLVFNWQFITNLGTEEEIALLTKDDLIDWHRRYFHADNSFILIYGDIEEHEIAKTLKDIDIPSNRERPVALKVNHEKKEIFIEREGVDNVEMVYGFRLPHYDIGWEILRVILGNYSISRLQKEFGEFTYTVGSTLEWTSTGGGFFLYFGATSIEAAHSVDKRLSQVLERLDIDEQELALAKKIRILEIVKMKEGGERGLMRFLACSPYLRNFEEMIEGIRWVNKDRILSLAREFLIRQRAVKVGVGKKS